MPCLTGEVVMFEDLLCWDGGGEGVLSRNLQCDTLHL
jgi:hypothetical protein